MSELEQDQQYRVIVRRDGNSVGHLSTRRSGSPEGALAAIIKDIMQSAGNQYLIEDDDKIVVQVATDGEYEDVVVA